MAEAVKASVAMFVWVWGAPFLTQCALDRFLWKRSVRWRWNLLLSAVVAVAIQLLRLAA